jgi:WD40 repeat protein
LTHKASKLTLTCLFFSLSELIGIRQNGAIQVYDASTNHAIVKTLTDEHEESATGLTISVSRNMNNKAWTNRYSFSFQDSFFATAGSDGKVMMFDANDNEFTKLLFRSQVPLRDVVFNSSGNKVAIASE